MQEHRGAHAWNNISKDLYPTSQEKQTNKRTNKKTQNKTTEKQNKTPLKESGPLLQIFFIKLSKKNIRRKLGNNNQTYTVKK